MKSAPHLLSEREVSEPRTKTTYSAASLLAHDVRNWLTVLHMYCDLLGTCGQRDARYPEWTRELSAALRRGEELVESLLEHAQATHGPEGMLRRTCLAPAHSRKDPSATGSAGGNPVDLAAAVANRLPTLQRMAGPRIQVNLQAESGGARAAISESDFDRILQNLFQNAREAMPQGGQLGIELSLLHTARAGAEERSSRMVVLRISDTGPGIPSTLLDRIFEPGISGKKICPQDRTEHGLGLAVVRDLTLRAGGAVRVRSLPGGGACLEVELPAARVVSSQATDAALPESRGRGTRPLREGGREDCAPQAMERPGSSRPPAGDTRLPSPAAKAGGSTRRSFRPPEKGDSSSPDFPASQNCSATSKGTRVRC